MTEVICRNCGNTGLDMFGAHCPHANSKPSTIKLPKGKSGQIWDIGNGVWKDPTPDGNLIKRCAELQSQLDKKDAEIERLINQSYDAIMWAKESSRELKDFKRDHPHNPLKESLAQQLLAQAAQTLAMREHFINHDECFCGGENPDGSSPTCHRCQALSLSLTPTQAEERVKRWKDGLQDAVHDLERIETADWGAEQMRLGAMSGAYRARKALAGDQDGHLHP